MFGILIACKPFPILPLVGGFLNGMDNVCFLQTNIFLMKENWKFSSLF